ncbi:MAG: tetratricopeptide repeat protein [Flavobacteriales bacterium]|nr:tetratricopeptide repeat protein [Flavobacteriales bacterium]
MDNLIRSKLRTGFKAPYIDIGLIKHNKVLKLAVLNYMKIRGLILPLLFPGLITLSACKSGSHASREPDSEVGYMTRKTFNNHYYNGAKAKVLGQYELAISEFEKAVNIIPGSHEAIYQLANVLFKEKRNDEAIHWAEIAIKRNKTYNHWYYGQLAQMYSVTRQYQKSAELFKKMVEKDPDRKSNYIEAGNQFINAENYKEAVYYFEKYIDKFGPVEEVCRKLENLYFGFNKPEDAVMIIEKLALAHPDNVQYLGLLAETQIKAKRNDEARETYLKILEIDENNGFACFGMADVLRKEGDNEASFKYLSKAFSDPNVNIQHKLKVITSYYFLIKKDETSKSQAFELAEKLIKTHPEDALGYQVYSDMLFAIDDVPNARKYLKSSLELDGSDYRLWQKLFGMDVKLSNDQFLYEDSKDALKQFASRPGLYIIHSQSAFRVKKYDLAIETAEAGLDISFADDERIQLYLTLADAWYEKKVYAKSDEYFEKAIAVDTQNPIALNNYAYNLFKRSSDLDKAERLIKKALSLDPDNGSYSDTYGCILMAKGNHAEAEEWIKKALSILGDHAEVLEHLGDLYLKMGDSLKASEIWKKALKLNPENKTLQEKLLKLHSNK